MADLDIADLLEREEKKAKERIRQEKLGDAGHAASEDAAMGGTSSEAPSFTVDVTAMSEQEVVARNHDSGHTHQNSHASNRYTSEREENDERRARRSRDHNDHTRGGSDPDSANGSVRSDRRTRSRSPRGDRRRLDRSRERLGGDYYRGGGRGVHDRDNDHYRPRDRHDSDRRHSSRDRSGRDRVDQYDRHGRDDDRTRVRGGRDGREARDARDGRDRGGRENRRSPGPSKRKTPEPTDDERDRRTIFVQQLANRLRSKELKQFFEQAGNVVDAQIVKDRVSGRSKGVGYVEFKEEESVQKAIQLTGQKLLGVPIIAQLTEAEKNRQARNNEGGATQSNGVPFHRLYVGNIHFSITENDLKDVFEPFGELEFVQLQKEEGGRSKGYGFVQFIDPTQAKEALEKMNGFDLAGRPIRVGLGNDKFTPESTQSLLQRFTGTQNHNQGSSFSGLGGRGAHAGGTGNFDRAGARENDKAGGASALDDTDVGGVNFNNYSRDSLMKKLMRVDEDKQETAPKSQQKKPIVEQPTATRCVLLKNMYDQSKESGSSWQKELEEDVKTECEEKYGKVVHIGLALDNNDGEIYIKFDRVQGGENAIRGLNGRWFDERMITAQYVVDAVYNMNFPKAASF